MSEFNNLAPFVGIGKHPPPDWVPAKHQPLLIVVGVTGTGKTTTLNTLTVMTKRIAQLPGRRALTDQLLIPIVQRHRGLPEQPVSDRLERFEMTRMYRQMHAGGMAHALTQLWFAQSQDIYLFDGLRGEAECRFAAQQLPEARFIVIDAPAAIRVQRLLNRGDSFDQVTLAKQSSEVTPASLGLTPSVDLFTEAEKSTLVDMVKSGQVASADMQAKVAIVVKEAQNYNPQAAIRALQAYALERTIVVNTIENSPTQAAQQIIDFLGLDEQ